MRVSPVGCYSLSTGWNQGALVRQGSHLVAGCPAFSRGGGHRCLCIDEPV